MRIKVPERITLEQGLYNASLESIDEVQNDKGPYLRWTFSITQGRETIRRVAHSSTSFGAKSKGHGWLQAAMGRSLSVGEEIDLDAILPLDCRILVKPTDDGYDRVEDVLAAKNPRQVGTQNRPSATFVSTDDDDNDLPF